MDRPGCTAYSEPRLSNPVSPSFKPGVILRDFSPEGSCAHLHDCRGTGVSGRFPLRGNLPAYLRHTCYRDSIFLSTETSPRKGPLENLYCLRCNRELEAGHKSVAVYMFAQTVGIRPRQKSAAQRICFCPQCSVSLAMGPPPEGALNIAAWNMIRDLVGADPALNEAAWESLRGLVGLLSATGTDGGPRRASAAGYFEF